MMRAYAVHGHMFDTQQQRRTAGATGSFDRSLHPHVRAEDRSRQRRRHCIAASRFRSSGTAALSWRIST